MIPCPFCLNPCHQPYTLMLAIAILHLSFRSLKTFLSSSYTHLLPCCHSRCYSLPLQSQYYTYPNPNLSLTAVRKIVTKCNVHRQESILTVEFIYIFNISQHKKMKVSLITQWNNGWMLWPLALIISPSIGRHWFSSFFEVLDNNRSYLWSSVTAAMVKKQQKLYNII